MFTGGFTLIEMVVVCAIVGMVAAMALPQLMPAIVFGKLEGSARHLAGYGRAAMAHATLLRHDLVVTVDLKAQTYSTVRLVEEEAVSSRLFDKGSDKEPEPDILDLMKREKAPSDEEMLASADLMREHFNNYIKAQVKARARMIKKDGILSDIGPLFDKKFKLDEKITDEPEEKPIDDPMLEPCTLPQEVFIESIKVGGQTYTEGQVRIELTAMGLLEPAVFYLKNEDGDYYTVVWDPITGSVRLQRGKIQTDDSESMAN